MIRWSPYLFKNQAERLRSCLLTITFLRLKKRNLQTYQPHSKSVAHAIDVLESKYIVYEAPVERSHISWFCDDGIMMIHVRTCVCGYSSFAPEAYVGDTYIVASINSLNDRKYRIHVMK